MKVAFVGCAHNSDKNVAWLETKQFSTTIAYIWDRYREPTVALSRKCLEFSPDVFVIKELEHTVGRYLRLSKPAISIAGHWCRPEGSLSASAALSMRRVRRKIGFGPGAPFAL